jgi:hypothetical protein
MGGAVLVGLARGGTSKVARGVAEWVRCAGVN